MRPHNQRSELILNDANDRVKDADVEFSPTNPTLEVFKRYPNANYRGHGMYNVPYNADGDTYSVDEDGINLGNVGCLAKYNARQKATRADQSKALLESEIAQRRAVRHNPEIKTLCERAAALNDAQLIKFADLQPDGMTKAEAKARLAAGGVVATGPADTEINLQRFFDAMFVGGKIDEVHYDTAGCVVRDEHGNEINDEWAARDLLEAARAVKFRGATTTFLVDTLKKWSRSHKFNDIRDRFTMRLSDVDTDGERRLDTFFINHFSCFDTADTRLFSKYWFVSTYMRIVQPGCFCPTTLVLIGGQNSGKSNFWRLVNKAIIGRDDASTVAFDPAAKEFTRFLRGISGRSFIAHMGEMTNFGKVDLARWKDFSTGSEDTFDQKFRDSKELKRQWIFGGDSNEYDGFWRDNADTDEQGNSQGERRMYPIFVGQTSDTGSVRWNAEHQVSYEDFEDKFMKTMYEAQMWVEQYGEDGYAALCQDVIRMVRAFSKSEKEKDQGTVRVKDFDESINRVLGKSARSVGKVKVGDEVVYGVKFFNSDLKRAYSQHLPGGKGITPQGITKKMAAMGAVVGRDTGANVTCYVFDIETIYGKEKSMKMLAEGPLTDARVAQDASCLLAAFDKKFVTDNLTEEPEKRSDEAF